MSVAKSNIGSTPTLGRTSVKITVKVAKDRISGSTTTVILASSGFTAVVGTMRGKEGVCHGVGTSVRFLLSKGFKTVLTILCTSLVTLPMPFTPIRLLFVGLLASDLPTVTLKLRPRSGGIVGRGPQPVGRSVLAGSFLVGVKLRKLSVYAVIVVTFAVKCGSNGTLLTDAVTFTALYYSELFRKFGYGSGHPIMFAGEIFGGVCLVNTFMVKVVLVALIIAIPKLRGVFGIRALALSRLLAICNLTTLGLPVVRVVGTIHTGFEG